MGDLVVKLTPPEETPTTRLDLGLWSATLLPVGGRARDGGGVAVDGDDGLVELSDAIGVVREQLIAAQAAGRRTVAGQVLTFAVGKVSIEFSGEVKKTAEGSGGVKFWVVTADAKVARSTGSAHKVTIELIPQTPEGKSFIVTEDTDIRPPSR
jgi:hypothetical protein